MMDIVSIFKKTIKIIGGYSSIPLCILVSFFILLSRYRLLKQTRDIVFFPFGGFGHTITGPDVVRRLFGFKKSVMIIFSDFDKHNWKTAHIWPDVTVIFLPLDLGIRWKRRALGFPCSTWYRSNAWKIIRSFIKMLGIECHFHLLEEDICNKKLIEKIQVKFEGSLPEYYARVQTNYLWVFYYFYLIRKYPAPKLHAPENILNDFRDVLRRTVPAVKAEKTKICCLYLRKKDINHTGILGNAFGNTRIGSDFAHYRRTIKWLNDLGYVVLIVGDVDISNSTIKEHNGMLLDHKSVGLGRDWFYVLAPTEADIFIGEAGGGSWLAGINGIPSLIMNAFPYGWSFPNAWVYYKTLRDKNGMLVPMKDILSKYLYCYEFPEGYTLNSASEMEIFMTVQRFIGDIKSPRPDKSDVIIKSLSDYACIKHANAKISTAWLELYDERNSEETIVSKIF